jgi:hypothetical protein
LGHRFLKRHQSTMTPTIQITPSAHHKRSRVSLTRDPLFDSGFPSCSPNEVSPCPCCFSIRPRQNFLVGILWRAVDNFRRQPFGQCLVSFRINEFQDVRCSSQFMSRHSRCARHRNLFISSWCGSDSTRSHPNIVSGSDIAFMRRAEKPNWRAWLASLRSRARHNRVFKATTRVLRGCHAD